MLYFDRRTASWTFTAATVLLTLYLVYLVRSTLFIFTLAILFAYLLSPLVNFLARFLPGSARSAALALAFVIFVAIAALFVSQVGERVVKQAEALNKRFPDMLARWQQPTPAVTPAINSLKNELIGKIRLEAARRSGELFSALPQYGMRILTAASNLIYLVLIPILAFFFLKDGHLIREHLLGLAAQGPHREMLDDTMADINLLLAGYMRALVGLTLIAFTTYSIFFTIMGVPYGIFLAAIAGALEFIPTMGPITASVAILLVVGVAGSHVLAVLIFLPIYRIVQDDIISPHLMEKGVALHPLLVFFGVFSGAEIAGIPGTFLSVPVLALMRILYLRIRKARLAATLESVR
jgi:predicted PurR-regulated permease PerM